MKQNRQSRNWSIHIQSIDFWQKCQLDSIDKGQSFSLSINNDGTMGYLYFSKPQLKLLYTYNLKLIIDWNVNPEAKKLLEKKKKQIFMILHLVIMHRTEETWTVKEKIDHLNFIKIQNFCSLKDSKKIKKKIYKPQTGKNIWKTNVIKGW